MISRWNFIWKQHIYMTYNFSLCINVTAFLLFSLGLLWGKDIYCMQRKRMENQQLWRKLEKDLINLFVSLRNWRTRDRTMLFMHMFILIQIAINLNWINSNKRLLFIKNFVSNICNIFQNKKLAVNWYLPRNFFWLQNA